jgi:hypothetical protein
VEFDIEGSTDPATRFNEAPAEDCPIPVDKTSEPAPSKVLDPVPMKIEPEELLYESPVLKDTFPTPSFDEPMLTSPFLPD